jgi:TonB-linked SusC/RagA family outer membrane protein
LAAFAVVTLATDVGAQTRNARVTGTVTDIETKLPIPGVTVRIAGTTTAATTGADGRYILSAPFSGVYALTARRIGYGERQVDNIRFVLDSVQTINFELGVNQLRLNQVTVSASVDPTSGNKTPYTVDKLTAADLPVPTTTSAAGALIGKVAGANITRASGAPGSGVYVQLRTPVSQYNNNNGPLYVIDGVFLNQTQSVTTQDIEALDIETIEVIKGAAAAALYGSRAASGVIAITTARGSNLQLGQTQFTLRTEVGTDQVSKQLSKPLAHQFLVNEQGQYINTAGQVVTRTNRVVQPSGIMENAYIDPTYDHAKQFFNPGTFNTQTATLQQNSAATNFTLSFTRNQQPGIIEGSNGFNRQSMRLNVDHRIKEKLSIGASVSYTASQNDPARISYINFYRFNPDVNLQAPDSLGRFKYAILPDPLSTATNPFYNQEFVQRDINRARTLLNLNAQYRPYRWLTLTGDVGYDRGDLEDEQFIPRGQTNENGEGLTTGTLVLDKDITTGLVATTGATITKAFGDLTARWTVRGQTEREVTPAQQGRGDIFTVSGVKTIQSATTRTASSSITDRRTNSVLSTVAFDYADKYIIDGLIRREGSSLFGPEARWNNFYRLAGSWLINEEDWFNVGFLDLFKLRYSIGTAGTRPNFADQYELLAVSTGAVVRTELGNPLLRPELTREQEFGVDMIINQKISASLVYVDTNTDQNIIPVPLGALFGYNTQNQNVGSITGNTIEATIQANLLQNPNGLQWDVLLTADRSRNYIGEFGRTCFTDGPTNYCDGLRMGQWFGNFHVKSPEQLRSVHANSLNQFQVDDNGYLVPVGVGNNYTDGKAKNLWNTTVRIDGINYAWGRPFLQVDDGGNLRRDLIADFAADLRFGFGNTFRYKGFRLYTLFNGQFGGDIYNQVRQTLLASNDHPEVNQMGKPDELRKPTSYYSTGVSNGNSGYQAEFVEDASFARLQEMAFGYLFDSRRHPWIGKIGASRIQADLVGRNLLTITNYSGINVEGRNGALTNLDQEVYPLTRTITAAFTITF